MREPRLIYFFNQARPYGLETIMSQSRYEEILENIHHLQQQLAKEIEELIVKKREEFEYHLEQGKVTFSKETLKLHKLHRTSLFTYLRRSKVLYILSAPIIYSGIFPLIFLDIFVFIYQQTCFRIYGIPLVSRAKYIVIDRQHLSYLNVVEKINCVYCGYGNGLIAYVREIFARTEQFWCPIKHAKRKLGMHHYEHKFTDYGDVYAYKQSLEDLRNELRQIQSTKQEDKHES